MLWILWVGFMFSIFPLVLHRHGYFYSTLDWIYDPKNNFMKFWIIFHHRQLLLRSSFEWKNIKAERWAVFLWFRNWFAKLTLSTQICKIKFWLNLFLNFNGSFSSAILHGCNFNSSVISLNSGVFMIVKDLKNFGDFEVTQFWKAPSINEVVYLQIPIAFFRLRNWFRRKTEWIS